MKCFENTVIIKKLQNSENVKTDVDGVAVKTGVDGVAVKTRGSQIFRPRDDDGVFTAAARSYVSRFCCSQ